MARLTNLSIIVLLVAPALVLAAEDGDWEETAKAGVKAFRSGQYKEAETHFRKCLKEAETFGEKDPRLAKALGNLSVLYLQLNKFDEAEALTSRSLALYRRAHGSEHIKVANALNSLAGILQRKGKFKQSEETFKEAIAIAEKLESGSSAVAAYRNNLANLLSQLGRDAESAPLYRATLALREKVLGPDHPQVAESSANLGMLLQRLGKLEEAEKLIARAIEITRKQPKVNRHHLALFIHALAEVQVDQGRYHPAKLHFDKALQIVEKDLPAAHQDRSMILGSLAHLHEKLWEYEEAERCYLKALAVDEKVFGKEHFYYAATLHSLGVLCYHMGRIDDADARWKQALAILEKRVPAEHPERIALIADFGNICLARKQIEKARGHFQRALALKEKVFGPEHLEVAASLRSLAALTRLSKGNEEAEALLRRSLAIREKALGERHPEVADSLKELAALLMRMGQAEEAFELLSKAVTAKASDREALFSLFSERQKWNWVAKGDWAKSALLSLARASKKPKTSDAAKVLECALTVKGVVLEAMVAQHGASHRDPESEEGRLAKRALRLRRQLARLLVVGHEDGGVAYRQTVAGLKKRLTLVEKELAQKVGAVALPSAPDGGHLDRLAKALPEDTAFVTYLRFDDVGATAKGDAKPRYLACALRKGGEARIFDLGPANAIDDAVAAYRTALAGAPETIQKLGESKAEEKLLAAGKQVFALVLLPLWDELEKSARWLISPDGSICVLNPVALPVKATKRLVIDQHEISFVPSGREIARFGETRVRRSGAFVFADPDYALVAKASSPAAGAPRRSKDMSPLRAEALPGTRKEAEALGELFRNAKVDASVLRGPEATRKRLLSLKPPRFLHIATHGFYLKEVSRPSLREGERGLAGIVGSAIDAPHGKALERLTKLENPLLRSGILLAGAGGPNGLKSGLVTAEELAGMNLWGTELVVLSACETGLGEITHGEGVRGLRWSFLRSGARAAVSSLWRVPDQQTQELMVRFYGNLLRGERRSLALRKAMLEVRDNRRKKAGAAHPYYWAGFLFSGDPTPGR